ncbi:hypothetical protein OGAPHI_003319 [Ogataea philodendri]|uniref:Uncharacterized protein n=1 Tax=Ogataea philodendri TaxID=1378263 RepID=A0A9P8P7X6_9ASCO|nr:uncharacterized protein OGAPHI_003319 [Ogataea philodendri]KAH3666870.1 hypothetical protein OGAPHI_003319 [Ogataea philodendri]
MISKQISSPVVVVVVGRATERNRSNSLSVRVEVWSFDEENISSKIELDALPLGGDFWDSVKDDHRVLLATSLRSSGLTLDPSDAVSSALVLVVACDSVSHEDHKLFTTDSMKTVSGLFTC